jgi:hypothetical protein
LRKTGIESGNPEGKGRGRDRNALHPRKETAQLVHGLQAIPGQDRGRWRERAAHLCILRTNREHCKRLLCPFGRFAEHKIESVASPRARFQAPNLGLSSKGGGGSIRPLALRRSRQRDPIARPRARPDAVPVPGRAQP